MARYSRLAIIGKTRATSARMPRSLTRIRAGRRSDTGVTVIELSVACVLLAGLATAAVLWLGGRAERAHNVACKSDVRGVAVAQQAYYDQSGTYPASTRDLTRAGLLDSEPPDGEVTIGRMEDVPGSMFAVGSEHSSCAGFKA